MRVIIDAFGGDNAPLEILRGSEAAVREYGADILLTGSEEKIKECAEANSISLEGMEILDAPDVMSMHDDPKEIIKSKSSTSMAVGLKALTDGKGDVFVSAGSTGALVFGSTFIVKRIKGIKRAALGSFIPTLGGDHFFLMDEGANADCRPEMLLQFGIMAEAYVKSVKGKEKPTVGLLNIGTEDTKGGQLQLEAYKLLENSTLNFIGNVESRELLNGVCDIVIADGFSGNICLKTIEGTASSLMKMIKGVFKKSLKNKIAAGIVLKDMGEVKKALDYTEIGGAPIIGVQKPVFKAHGSSDAKAIKNAIKIAMTCAESNMIGDISEYIKALKENDNNEEA